MAPPPSLQQTGLQGLGHEQDPAALRINLKVLPGVVSLDHCQSMRKKQPHSAEISLPGLTLRSPGAFPGLALITSVQVCVHAHLYQYRSEASP